jgi:hypothetical protein
MKKIFSPLNGVLASLTVLCMLTLPVMSHAYTLTQDIYTLGSNPLGNALNLSGVHGGIPYISWNFNVTQLGAATISIVAEGIDGGRWAPNGGENDLVFFNGHLLGQLTQQNFYSSSYMLNPGAGALSGTTALTTSSFDVSSYLLLGVNSVFVKVERGWVNEIETSKLDVQTPVPEPSTFLLFGVGIGSLALWIRRKR